MNKNHCGAFVPKYFAAIFLLALYLISCGGGNTSSSSQNSKESKPQNLAISLNFPETVNNPAARGVSPDNAARALPSYVTGIRLTISGDGMDPLLVDIPLDTLSKVVYLTNGIRRFDIAVLTNIGKTFTASVTAEIGGASSPSLNFDLAINAAPVINGLSASSSSVNKNSGVTISASASDLDGDPLTYSWNGGGGSISGSGSSVTWSASKAGDYTIGLTVDDGRGGTDTSSTQVTVINRTPAVTSITADTTSPNVGHNVQLACSASDADGDRLSYSWSDGHDWTATGDTAVYTVNLTGEIIITCTVSDGDRNGTASATLTLNGTSGATSPNTPTGVTATAAKNQVTISWTAVTGATSYNIYWRTTRGVTTANGTKIAGAASPYVHTGLTNGTTYYYIVTAVSGGVESSASAEVNGLPEAIWTVTKTADTNDGVCDADCSLREAIGAANAGPGGEKVSIPAGTYNITIAGANEDLNATGDFDIKKNMTITGAGAASTIIDGGALDRVFHITGAFTVNISNVTITNGKSPANIGGGIYNNMGTLTITNSTISNNLGENGAGGINNQAGTVNITNSTLSGNTSSFGTAGALVTNGGTVNITGSTISGNSSNQTVGGIQNGGTMTIINSTLSGNSSGGVLAGAIYNNGTLTITNSTISNNSAGQGAGIYNAGGAATISNTIVASQNFGTDCTVAGGAITSNGKNLESGVSCGFAAGGDLQNSNPLLGALGNNGGSTQTMALGVGSPAIDAGSCVQATDQRGTTRPRGATCDIGAYEY